MPRKRVTGFTVSARLAPGCQEQLLSLSQQPSHRFSGASCRDSLYVSEHLGASARNSELFRHRGRMSMVYDQTGKWAGI